MYSELEETIYLIQLALKYAQLSFLHLIIYPFL